MCLLEVISLAEFPKYGQGPAAKTDESSEPNGYTHPDLHRRTDPSKRDNEVSERTYQLGIYSTNSFRTVDIHYHDEESEDSEIP